MRLAWFAPGADSTPASGHRGAGAPDHLQTVKAELEATHEIDAYDAAAAHQFVWRHFRQPYDLCVYELADTPQHQFAWPYLVRYPGVVVLRAAELSAGRAAELRRARRATHYDGERAFAGAGLLRTPMLAASVVAVFDEAAAAALRDRFPGVDVRAMPVGVAAAGDQFPAHPRPASARRMRFTCLDSPHGPDAGRALAERALQRARNGGADVELLDPHPIDRALRDADVILALQWPPALEPPANALLGMAAGKPVVVFETEVTAAWPALDPQTWQPRGHDPLQAPIAVSIDPRDDEHSLMLTMRRLAGDSGLCTALGAAAQGWWREQATVDRAATAWRALLEEAVDRHPPPRPAGWPHHFDADGSEHARAILDEFGVTVDFL
jgi:hypothetical protein